MSNSFDPDQALCSFRPDLGQNCLQRSSADYKIRGYHAKNEGLDGGVVFTIHLKFSPLFISLKFWVIHSIKTNYSLKVRKVAEKSDYSLVCVFFNSLKNMIIH